MSGRPIPPDWAEGQITRCLDTADKILQNPKTRLFGPRESALTWKARAALKDLVRQRDEATFNCATWRKEAELARASVADLIRERDEARADVLRIGAALRIDGPTVGDIIEEIVVMSGRLDAAICERDDALEKLAAVRAAAGKEGER